MPFVFMANFAGGEAALNVFIASKRESIENSLHLKSMISNKFTIIYTSYPLFGIHVLNTNRMVEKRDLKYSISRIYMIYYLKGTFKEV